MITKINKESNNYAKLFADAEEQLGKPEGSISSIHEYLDALSEIKVINGVEMSVRQDPNNYNLLRLPVEEDEPLFEIDANTREIKVPDVFKRNGLTVQGDKLAEIIYFKMARFFDMMDLYRFANDSIHTNGSLAADGPHTYIEWQNLSSKNPDYEKGVDYAYAMTCDDNYIYFGWPLAEYVSGDAGQIQFAVRFLEIEEGQVVYNYATKIAQCEIKSTLNFNLMDGSVTSNSWEDILYTRPIYSSVINSTQSPAPILIRGIETDVYDLIETEVQVPTGETDPESDEPLYETETRLLLPIPVEATISTAVGKNPQTGLPLEQQLIFKWIKDGGQVTSAAEIAEHIRTESIPGSEDPNAIRSTYTADEVGTYTVWIGNKIEGKKNVRYIYTGVVSIPKPEPVSIKNNGIIERHYVGHPEADLVAGIVGTKKTEETLYYTWYMKNDNGEDTVVQARSTNNVYVPQDEGIYYCRVQNYRNGEFTSIEGDNVRSRDADIRTEPQSIANSDIDLEYDNEGRFFSATINNRAYPNHSVHWVWFRLNPETGLPEKVKEVEVGTAYNDLAVSEPGRYYVEAREVVFPEDSILRKEASLAQRGRSIEIEIVSGVNGALTQKVD